jgi:hypothetical protein
VIAPCIASTLVSRSSTTVEMETFMTVPSSTITNCALPRIAMTDHLLHRMWAPITTGSSAVGV